MDMSVHPQRLPRLMLPSLLSILVLAILASRTCASSVLQSRHPSGLSFPSTSSSVRDSTPLSSELIFDHDASEDLALSRRQSGSSDGPTAFDRGFGAANMSSSCAVFFKSFLQDSSLTACQPISLLLQTSSSFFQASKTAESLAPVVSTSCAANQKSCSQKMTNYANQLTASGTCGGDYQRQNPYVLQAYDGFIAYDALYNASCAKAANGTNCFVNAMTDSDSDSSYVYYLPLGFSLPLGSKPSCNDCIKNTMDGWTTAAGNTTTPIGAVYNPAATQMNQICGSNFVKQAVEPKKDANGASCPVMSLWLFTLVAMTAYWVL